MRPPTFRQDTLPRLRNFVALLAVPCILFTAIANAQEKEIDPSKPTNLYSRLNNNFEYTNRKSGNDTWGYRANLNYASRSEAHSVSVELPLLYATKTEKFGLGDIRFRYFWVPYKNYAKMPGAYGMTVDVFAPTGKAEDGLGSDRWTIAPGLTTGFVFGKFATFPILSYQYSSKQTSDLIPESQKKELHGATVQAICVYNLSASSYFDFTPAFIANNFEEAGADDFQVEANYFYMAKKNKLQIGGFIRRTFKSDVTTLRGSVRVFL